MHQHTNDNIPSSVKIKRAGDRITMIFNKATITLTIGGAGELAAALKELSSPTSAGR
ncbi:hypothetical protein EV561_10131 [Rhizobium sp. BK376]|nr:hypothetical protein EV561_10131 [Rhizobium sp. BK376]